MKLNNSESSQTEKPNETVEKASRIPKIEPSFSQAGKSQTINNFFSSDATFKPNTQDTQEFENKTQ